MSKLMPEEKTVQQLEDTFVDWINGGESSLYSVANCPLCKAYWDADDRKVNNCLRCPVEQTDDGCGNSVFNDIDMERDIPGVLAIMVYLHGFNHV